MENEMETSEFILQLEESQMPFTPITTIYDPNMPNYNTIQKNWFMESMELL